MDEILQAIAKIDGYLPGTAQRDLIPAQEVQDMLLDLRLAMQQANSMLHNPVLTGTA